MQDLRVSLIQYNQKWEDKKGNLAHLEKMLETGVQQPTDIVVFPEMFQTGFSMNPEVLSETMEGESVAWLKRQARNYNAAMVASVIIEENGNYYNRGMFIEPDGTTHTYDKQKLFTFSKEELHFAAGNRTLILEFRKWKIRLQVCYDLRFPDMATNRIVDGKYDYDVLINVANWPAKRSLHWKTLLRARAIENQAYVIGVNRVGENAHGLYYSGDSSIIAVDGSIVNHVFDEEIVINDELEVDALKESRKMLPFLKDR